MSDSKNIKKLNVYSAEFKESSVKLAVENNYPIAQTAKELGVNVNTLHTWIGKYSNHKQVAMYTNEHHFAEIKNLKKELHRVTQERDLLKKAAAYFAKESL